MATATSVRERVSALVERLGAREQTFIVALIVFVTIHFAWLVYRLPIPLEIFTNEAWNAWHAVAATGVRTLYPGKDELIINNYTPLSFYLVGYVGRAMGDVMLAGRIISLASAIVIAGCVSLIVRRFGGGLGAAAIGALWWLASIFRSGAEYVGANDPTVPALAVMMVGFTWFLVCMDARRSVLPAVALMVVAGFFKHNLVVLPVVALIWYAQQDLAGAARAGVFGTLLAAVGLVACNLAYGPDFITQLTLPREIRWLRPVQHLNRLQYMIVALVVWGMWIASDRRGRAARFTALWIGLGFASFVLQKLSPGVANNASFEMWIGVAVGFGLAMANLASLPAAFKHGVGAVRGTVLALFVVRLLADPGIEPYRLASSTYRAEVAARAALFDREVAAVRAGPKPVGCSIMSVCFRAGEPFLFDNFGAGMRVSTRHMSSGQYAATLDRLGLGYRFSDPRISWERNSPRPPQVGVTVPFPR